MMYHPIKFGCKKISSSVAMVETVISDHMNPHCDPELEDSKQIFLHDTLTNDDASPNQVWFQMIQHLRIIQMNWNFEPFLWPWPWPQQSNPIYSQDNLAYDDVPIKLSLIANGAAVQKIY